MIFENIILYISLDYCNNKLQQGKRAYIAFIDLGKAFDRVPRNKIWVSLRDRGVNDRLLKNILHHHITSIEVMSIMLYIKT